MPHYPLDTPAAADLLGVSYARLYALSRYSKLHPAPQRDIHLKTIWSKADLVRARKIFASRRLRSPKSTTAPAENLPQ
jgi:hypothetical protein